MDDTVGRRRSNWWCGCNCIINLIPLLMIGFFNIFYFVRITVMLLYKLLLVPRLVGGDGYEWNW